MIPPLEACSNLEILLNVHKVVLRLIQDMLGNLTHTVIGITNIHYHSFIEMVHVTYTFKDEHVRQYQHIYSLSYAYVCSNLGIIRPLLSIQK